MLNNTEGNVAYKIAERIRKELEKRNFIFGDNKINVTASLGISSIKDKEIEAEELIREADKNLYKAKGEGRNKTII